MRPNAIESLRAVQGGVANVLAPEVTSLFAQEAVQAVSMIVESLVAEWDTAAQDLTDDNRILREILARGRGALNSVNGRNDAAGKIVSEIDGVLRQAGDGSIAVSSLAAENNRLRAALVVLLEYAEDSVGQGDKEIDAVRADAYRHLRQVATRGWSWFDVAGFRERMAKARAEAAR